MLDLMACLDIYETMRKHGVKVKEFYPLIDEVQAMLVEEGYDIDVSSNCEYVICDYGEFTVDNRFGCSW